MEDYEGAENQPVCPMYTHYGISTSFLDKRRHNENVEIRSLDILCSILDCDFGDIVEHIPDNAEPEEK